MSVAFKSQDQAIDPVNQNITNKGFTDKPPTPGCTYVMQPPQEYQHLFQDLQETLTQAGLPTANVRIPHATVIAAKVIDKKQNESWKDLEEVQRIYRSFLLFHVDAEMEKSHCDYSTALENVIKAHEGTLADIAGKANKQDALIAIKDEIIRKSVDTIPASDKKYDRLKDLALKSINETSFELKIAEVKLTNNGSIIFQLTEDDRLLKMRLDLIVAGQGISKWAKLSVMKSAWSTVGYTAKVLSPEEKEKLEIVLKTWTEKNQQRLQTVTAKFDVDHLGVLAFRSNDFYIAKKAVFPLAKRNLPNLQINTTKVADESDLALTPYAGDGGITPIAGNRKIPDFGKEDWNRPINEEIVEPKSPKKKSKRAHSSERSSPKKEEVSRRKLEEPAPTSDDSSSSTKQAESSK